MTTPHLRSSVMWTTGESLVTLLSSIVTSFVVARLIGTTDFGLASLAYMTGSLAEALVGVAFMEPLVRRRAYDKGFADTAFTGLLVSSVAAFVLLCAFSPALAAIYQEPILGYLLIAQALTCVLLGIRGVPEALLARKLRFKTLAIRGIIAKLASSVFSMVLAFAGAGAWSLILGNIAFALAATIIVLSLSPRIPRLTMDLRHLREMLSFGRFSLAEAFFGGATPRLFPSMVGYFSGVSAAGELSIAFRITDGIGALIGAVTVRLALPMYSRLVTLKRNEFDVMIMRGTEMTFMIAAPVFVGLAVISHDVTALVLGPEWRGAALALVTVNLFALLNFAVVLNSPIIKALGRPDRAALVPAAGFVLVVVGGLIAAPFGLAAQLAVWVVYGLLYFSISALNLRWVAGVSYRRQLSALSGAALSSVPMVIAVFLASHLMAGEQSWRALGAKIIAGASAYLLASLAFQRRALITIFMSRPTP